MTAQKSKHNNFCHGLSIGLVPVFIFSLLLMLTRGVSVTENSDQNLIVEAIQVTLVVAIFFFGGIYFVYFYHRFEGEGKSPTVKKGLEVSFFLSIFIVTFMVRLI